MERDELIKAAKLWILHFNWMDLDKICEIGSAWALLSAGCDYTESIDRHNRWIEIALSVEFEGFDFKETGDPDDKTTLYARFSSSSDRPTADDPIALPSDDDRYPRQRLLEICEKAIVPQERWGDRDSAAAQKNVGQLWALLLAGYEYRISWDDDLCATNKETVWVVIEEDWYYLPTQERLDDRNGRDWY